MRVGILVLVLLLTTRIRAEEASAHERTLEHAGLKLHVALELDAKEIMVGEPLYVRRVFTNQSDERVFVVRGYFLRPTMYSRLITLSARRDGVHVPLRRRAGTGSMVWSATMPLPARQRRWEGTHLATWLTIDTPGQYTVTLRDSIGITRRELIEGDADASEIMDLSVPLTVVPWTPEKGEAVVARYGRRLSEPDGDGAARILATIPHREAIPWLVRGATPGHRSAVVSACIDGLGQFDDSDAVRALRTVLDWPVEGRIEGSALSEGTRNDLRVGAASALLRSPHTSALPVLVTYAADPNPRVRRQVVRGLGKRRNLADLDRLRKMLKDDDSRVRQLAAAELEAARSDDESGSGGGS